jgi:adenine deaminase
MSLAPYEDVLKELVALRQAARDLGCTLPEPFLQVSFLALPVIPHLKITDMGLFDVDRFALVDF